MLLNPKLCKKVEAARTLSHPMAIQELATFSMNINDAKSFLNLAAITDKEDYIFWESLNSK